MPNWRELAEEVKSAGSTHDVIRRRYLSELFKHTGRNVIVYYSGWLQKGDLQRQGIGGFSISDADKNGFMTTIHGMDRAKGLDLVLHTPGGDAAATESLVDYLRSMFGTDVRAVVPQIAMSAGTMIACACREILMGKHSSLGPIDPQIGGLAAHGVIEEFTTAQRDVTTNQLLGIVWQPIIAKYSPTLIGECQKAIKWAETMVTDWLVTGMFRDEPNPADSAKKVLNELGSHALTLSHARHISLKRAQDLGLKVTPLESNAELQDAILSVHHACIQTLTETPALKIIENHEGVAFISTVRTLTLTQ
ncbi:MAG: S49 family peptidase [Acidobacteriia bacterium]|nr:S49 family peptidase [Terriglobia bacterium]